MEDGTDLVYILMDRLYTGDFATKAICVCKDEYDDYVRTHNVKGLRTLVVNPNNPKVNKCGDFMEKVYESRYSIVDYYGDVPLTSYEEEMLSEAEAGIHHHIVSQVSQIRQSIAKDFIRLSKEEKDDIEKMLAIVYSRAMVCIDSDEECESDPCERINYNELIKQSKLY